MANRHDRGGGLLLQDTYKEAVIFRFPGMVARVYIPILDAEEREKRMKAIHIATANVLKSKIHS